MSLLRIIKKIPPGRSAVWALRWMGYTLGIIGLGTILGAILFPLVGHLAGVDKTTLSLISMGIYDGGFYAMIWAPGTALVICVYLAGEARKT